MQVTIDISEDQAQRLFRLQRERGASPDDLVREALTLYLPDKRLSVAPDSFVKEPSITNPEESSRVLERAFGLWKDFNEDSVDYQRRERS